MNKLVRLFSILALASTVAFVSCQGEKGDTGPVGQQGTTGQPGTNGGDGADGVNGQDGQDGNANIMSYSATIAMADWTETQVPGVMGGSSSTWGASMVANDAITADKFVLAWLINGETEYALPLSLSKEIDGSVEALQYSSKTGQLNLYYKSQTSLFGGSATYVPAADLSIKYIVVAETLSSSMKSAGVSLSDYNEVVNYLNRTVQIPSQL